MLVGSLPTVTPELKTSLLQQVQNILFFAAVAISGLKYAMSAQDIFSSYC